MISSLSKKARNPHKFENSLPLCGDDVDQKGRKRGGDYQAAMTVDL